jgi:UDP-N-acetylglucosamine 2-epimerase (non-hydrolysing)
LIRVLFVFGTRPEGIKLAPVVHLLSHHPGEFSTRVCVTAQHRDMLDQALDIFAIHPDYDLDLMTPGQSLFQSTARIVAGLEEVLERERPDYLLVQGDTTTTFCAALAAFYQGVAVGHVEAGLRTGDMRRPFPEEMNRVLASRLAALHFAPTESAARNLRREGVPEDAVFVTGNTGIDALRVVREGLEQGRLRARPSVGLDPSRKLILVTAHRRESFGAGLEGICTALRRLAQRGGVEIVYPVHPNPNVREPVERMLAGAPGIHLIEPLTYVDFVDLMRRSWFLLTDSGGIQEEAPSLGKPVLVMREKTERPEAILAGTARLVGTDPEIISREAGLLLEDPAEYERRSRIRNPYGDGHAAERIRSVLLSANRAGTAV